MAIRFTCECGANIRTPESAVGKRARCRACGAVLTVPAPSPRSAASPPPHETESESGPNKTTEESYSWLDEFADAEADTRNQRPVTVITNASEEIDLSDAKPPPPVEHGYPSLDAGRSGVVGPRQPFWRDLVESFTFFMTPGNMVTFLVIALLNVISVPLGHFGILGVIACFFIFGYLCAFYLLTILETASGEDELPEVWISSIFDDLFIPLVQFLATWLLVLVPAGVVALISLGSEGKVAWTLVRVLAGAGLALWPVVILGVAVGRSVIGLWPHMAVRTVLAAPIPYLAVCAALALAAGLLVLPSTNLFQSTVNRFIPGAAVKLAIFNSVLTAYAMIVAMRVIGLFYRHYKQKFPWAAE